MQNKRSRTVSFRLSDEEYQALKNVSALRGARSVSEFTRSVACSEHPHGNGNGEEQEAAKIDGQLRDLYERMSALDRSLKLLTNELKLKEPRSSTQPANKERLS